MKTAFKNTLFIALFSFINIHAAQTEPNFELWNKHQESIYFSKGASIQELNKKPFELLRPGKWISQTIDNKKPTVLAISVGKKPEPGNRIDLYTIKPGKTLYLRIGLPAEKEKFKELLKAFFGRFSIEGDGYIFGPQVGPLLGFKGVTERGYPLKNNLGKDDISKGSMIYLPKK